MNIHIISKNKFLMEAIQNSGELPDTVITAGTTAVIDNSSVVEIIDKEASYNINNKEFIKPCSLKDLITTIKEQIISRVYIIDNLQFEPKIRKIISSAGEENLTETENAILLKLCAANGNTITGSQLLSDVLGYKHNVETNTLETHIYRLRQKLKNLTNTEIIVNLGNGYYIPMKL